MRKPSTFISQPFFASTGRQCADSIAFSAPPSTVACGPNHYDVFAFENIGAGHHSKYEVEILVEHRDLLTLSLTGGGVCERAEGNIWSRYRIRPGTLAYVPAGFERKLRVSGMSSNLTISLPAGLLAKFGNKLPDVSQVPFSDHEDQQMNRLLRLLSKELSTPGFAADILINGLLMSINALMVRRTTSAVLAKEDRIYISPQRMSRIRD